MATYVIGDVQGCFDALMQLLKKINFKVKKDKLIFCGDLVNRGGQSLEVLRWVYAHQKNCQVVLGNHDLSLLAKYYLPKTRKRSQIEFETIFKAKDCDEIMTWLKSQKLLIHKKKYQAIIVHAGIHPLWSLKCAKIEAQRVNHWSYSINGMDRIRFAINSFTRMRFLYKNGGLNFKAKGELLAHSKLMPWFLYKKRKKLNHTIIFGHWSSLGLHAEKKTLCIDTGKVWGGKLTALKLKENTNGRTFKTKNIIQV